MSVLQKQPEIVVFAGPNGSGKSTITELLKLLLLKRAKKKGYFVRCYYVLTADPMINVWRVRSRVESGGHDVPEEKIIKRYDKALALVKDLIDMPYI